MKKKWLSVILALSIILSCFTINAYANTDVTDPAEQKMYTVLDKIVNALVGGIAAMIVTPNWPSKDNYKSENFYPGLSSGEFAREAQEGAKWNIGYANASLLTGKEVGGGDYYVGGSLSVTKKLATYQYDDQKVRTVAISDGRGISIFSSLDAYGMASSDVRAIRAKFAQYAEEKGLEITSINISALHQHSCVDTFGMNGDIVNALFTASIKNLFRQKMPGGQNPEYMKNLYNVTVNSMIEAVDDMKPGELYYGNVDVSEYIRDKRAPEVFDGNMNRFRFVPDDENAPETWICNCGIHCVGNGAGGTELTGDYPYYMEKYINEKHGANFYYVEGAELAISDQKKDLVPDEDMVEQYDEGYAMIIKYGETLAAKMEEIDNETLVEPIFNIAFREVWVPIENNVLVLAAKGGLLVNTVVKSGIGKYEILTEVGYAEFGKDIVVSIIPGELAPEIAFGGAETAETSWYGTNWTYDSFQDLAGDKKVLVFGITNDQIGYLLTSNNWHSYFTENEEIVSTGRYAGEIIAAEYTGLYNTYN